MVRKVISNFRFGLLTAALLSSGTAFAQSETCTSIISSYKQYVTLGNTTNAQAYLAAHPECFGSSGNSATAAKNIQGTSLEQILAISTGVGSRSSASSAPPGVVADSGQGRGMAAGNVAQNWNVWGNVAQTNQKYDRGVYQLTALVGDRTNKYDNRIQNSVLGFDYLVDPAVSLGLSAGFDSGSGSASSYLIATPTAAKNVSTSGYSIAPYLGWQINKDWSMDVTGGWGKGKSRVDNSIKTDSKRSFFGLNANYTTWYDKLQVSGKGGYLYGQENSSDSVDDTAGTLAGTGVNNKIGQVRLAGQVAYWFDGFMPYLGLAYMSDSRSSNASADQKLASEMGNTAALWSLGANFISVRNGVTGGISYEKETGRSRSKNDKVMANIGFRF